MMVMTMTHLYFINDDDSLIFYPSLESPTNKKLSLLPKKDINLIGKLIKLNTSY